MKTIMDASAIQRAITRITYEILERNHGADQLAVIGIYSRGVILAERIVERIAELEHRQVELGALDITTYRDDKVVPNHAEKTKIDFSVQDKKIILVDDVLYTGRSCRAAMDAVLERGRPTSIQLAVLIDRGHRELPIRPEEPPDCTDGNREGFCQRIGRCGLCYYFLIIRFSPTIH